MVKVRKVGSRGTSSYEKDEGPQNWAGDAYRKVELNRLKKTPKGETMHLGRGVRTSKAKDLPDPKPRPSTEGMTRITSRGTGSRKSKNKGS
ncbi:MAG: hypothetical protein ACE5GR_05525 [Nitrosopumilus sp.]